MSPYGREYETLIEVAYTVGRIDEDVRGRLATALHTTLRDNVVDISVSISTDAFNVVTVSATLRETSPLAAITKLDRALDESLSNTGLLEEFDITGKALRAAPVHRWWPKRGRNAAQI